jgi:hypothetical protein
MNLLSRAWPRPLLNGFLGQGEVLSAEGEIVEEFFGGAQSSNPLGPDVTGPGYNQTPDRG